MEMSIAKIPVFQKKSHRRIFHSKGTTTPLTPLPKETANKCQCSHVLLADDDRFQAFYYQTLFQKSLDFDHLSIDKKDFRFTMSTSGEDLLEEFKKIQACKCGFLSLIIVDYDMGRGKMTGVETILTLRKLGYKGMLILRTSETYEFLREKHPYLDDIIENKTINYLLGKNDHMETKGTIQTLLYLIFS